MQVCRVPSILSQRCQEALQFKHFKVLLLAGVTEDTFSRARKVTDSGGCGLARTLLQLQVIKCVSAVGLQCFAKAIELNHPHTFLMFAPAETISRLCKKVMSLTLRDKCYPLGSYRSLTNEPIVTIAGDILVIAVTGDSTPISLPAGAETPDLTHLTIIDSDIETAYVKQSLQIYGHDLQRLDLSNATMEFFDSLFDTITAMNIDVLRIQQATDDYWEDKLDGGYHQEWVD